MTNESIKTKIAALLAKAERTDNEHEASAFMAKVNELLEKHQIEMFEIRSHNGDKDPMSHLKGMMTRTHEWPTYVGFKLAKYYGAKLIRSKTPDGKKTNYVWTVVGRESACTTFELMFPFVQTQVRQLARQFSREYGVTIAKAERSVGMQLAKRIECLCQEADDRRAELRGNALIPVSDNDAYAADLFSKITPVNGIKKPISHEARAYAEKVSINHQATESTARQLT